MTQLKNRAAKQLALIVAVAKNGVIGKNNELPWRLRADLQWFKRCTTGHTIVMGRKTYESIGRPLPGRQNVVLSRREFTPTEAYQVCTSLDDAVSLATNDKVFVIGGAQIYRMAMPLVDHLYITVVDALIEGDTWFPFVDFQDWELLSSEHHAADENNQYDCQFRCYRRVTQ